VTAPPFCGPVLVIAPHPDDESAGPGGAIAQHAARGDAVSVVYVTNGVHGDPTGEREPSAYIELRRREAESACDILGIGAREFWGLPDGCAVTPTDLANVTSLLVDAINRTQPATVYAPHVGESHPDHHFIGLATERAIASLADAGNAPVLVGYEVWSPLAAEIVLDVTDVYDAKRDAVRCYPSQLAHTDILAAIEGLNAYRAILLPHHDGDGGRRAECYRVVLPSPR